MNPQMFNPFLTAPTAIEMAAIANACPLDVPPTACCFRPAASTIYRMRCGRGCGRRAGEGRIAEVVSSLERDGRPRFRLRWGATSC
jgi:hypothetical protein